MPTLRLSYCPHTGFMARKSKSLNCETHKKRLRKRKPHESRLHYFYLTLSVGWLEKLTLKIPKYCIFCRVIYRLTIENRSIRQSRGCKAKYTRKELGDLVQKRFGTEPRYLVHNTAAQPYEFKYILHLHPASRGFNQLFL